MVSIPNELLEDMASSLTELENAVKVYAGTDLGSDAQCERSLGTMHG